MADSTTSASSATSAASAPEKVLKYVGLQADYNGPKGSHKEITKTQFKEAGFPKPFVDDSQDVVVWQPSNGYQVAKSVFTPEAYNRLLQEDDLEEATA